MKSSKNRIWKSIQGRLIGLLLVVLIPILIMQTVIYYDRFQTRKVQEFQANLELARSVAKTFEAFIRDVLHQELAIGAAFTSSHPWTPSDQYRLLEKSKTAYPAVRDFSWISPQGRVLVAVDRNAVGTDISDRAYFREILSGQEWAVSELLLSRVDREPIFTISRGIRDEGGRLIGVVFAAVTPDRLDSVLQFDRSGSGAVTIIDGEGRAVYRQPSIEWSWEKRNLLDTYPILRQVFEGREVTGTSSQTLDGEKRMFALVPILSVDWVVGASRPEREALAPVFSYLNRHISMFLFVVLASFLVALVVARSLADSVRKLQRHALALGRGEMSKMAEFDGPVELQDLGVSLNRMVEEIHIREAQWQAVFGATRDAIFLVDETAKCVDANPAAVFSLGMAKEKVIGRTLSDFAEPGFDFKSAWDQFQREGHYQNQLKVIRQDRGSLEMEVTVVAHVLPGKHLIVAHDITHLIEAEMALRQAKDEAERRAAELEAVWESLAEGVIFYGKDHMIARMNLATEKILGFDLEDVKLPAAERVKLFTLRMKDGRIPAREELVGWRALMGETLRNEEFIIYPKGSDNPVHILSSAAPIRTSGGELLGAIQTIVDITALKSAQEELRRSRDELEVRVRERTTELEQARNALRQERDKLQVLIDSMADEVWFCDIEGNLIPANAASRVTLRELGLESPEEWSRPIENLAGKLEYYDENDHPRDPGNSPLLRSLRGEVLKGMDEALRYPETGELRRRQCSSAPVRTASGDIMGAVAVIRDVTEQKRMEKSLRLDEARFEALYKLSQMGEVSVKEIIDFALEEQIKITESTIGTLGIMSEDEGVYTVHGWSETALKKCAMMDKPLHLPIEGAGVWAEAVRKRKPLVVNDYAAPNPHKKGCPAGHVALSRFMSIPIFDEEKIVAVATIGNKEEDYTDSDVRQVELLMDGMWKLLKHKQMEEERKAYVTRLEQSNRELEEFAFVASHDLQEPLRKIQTFADRVRGLHKDSLSEKGHDYLERVQRAAGRMQDLIQDLLRYSRITSKPEPFTPVDLKRSTEEAVANLRILIEETGGTVEMGDLPTVEADALQICQLFQNLIGNALKYHGENKPVIQVDSTCSDEFCEIRVKDNGIGFDETFLDKIFRPFQRLHDRTGFYRGTGMGLAICRRIVERHGGTITATSEPGKGATFIVTLPRKQLKMENLH